MSALARLWVIEWKRKGVREAWRKWATAPTKASALESMRNAIATGMGYSDYRVVPYYRKVEP